MGDSDDRLGGVEAACLAVMLICLLGGRFVQIATQTQSLADHTVDLSEKNKN